MLGKKRESVQALARRPLHLTHLRAEAIGLDVLPGRPEDDLRSNVRHVCRHRIHVAELSSSANMYEQSMYNVCKRVKLRASPERLAKLTHGQWQSWRAQLSDDLDERVPGGIARILRLAAEDLAEHGEQSRYLSVAFLGG